MRIDIELFAAGEEAGGAVLVGGALGFAVEVRRHPRSGSGNAAAPTHEVRLVGNGVDLNDIALWKKTSQSGDDYLNGALIKGGNWWVNVNYLQADAPSGAVAKLTVRHSPPKQDQGMGGGEDGTGGRF